VRGAKGSHNVVVPQVHRAATTAELKQALAAIAEDGMMA
jgi:hypothetical protein